MVKSIHCTFGILKVTRNKRGYITKFEQIPYGEDIEFYIEFDNGSSKGYCRLENLQKTIIDHIKIHEGL